MNAALRPEHPTWSLLAGYVALYVLLDWLSYIHPVFPLAITPWNPPPALSLVLLLRFGLRSWPALFVAALAAEVVVRDIPLSLFYAVLSSLWLAAGYALAAWLLRGPLRFDARFRRLRDVFVFIAMLLPLTLLIGAGYVGVYAYAGLIPTDRLIESSLHFWIGDLIGTIVLAPLLLVHWPRLWPRPRVHFSPENWAQAGAILLTLWLIFGIEATDEFKFFYLLFMPLTWVAVRHGVEGSTLANLAIQLGLIGAFQWSGHPAETVLEFQLLMLALAVTGLFLGMAISERQQALASLAEQETVLSQALRAAAVGEMTSALAHELNQPLMAMSNYARACQHVAAELPDAPLLNTTLDKLVGEVSHAGSVVHRLREYYRYGDHQRETLQARAFFLSCIDPLLHRAKRHGIQLSLLVDEAVSDFRADPVQVGSVLHNLVANAIEALESCKDCVRVITVHVGMADRFTVQVCVQDCGPGVDAERLDPLFSAQHSSKPQGMGLGLSICRSMVEGHGGRIWHEVPAGGGARFCFTLPTAEEDLGPDHLHR